MYGVDGPFVGDANPIRGVVGDELPWEVASARGRLDTDGHLRIHVRGLVFTHDPEVPPDKQGINDEEDFRALVSCLSEDESQSAITTVNVTTEGFPATPTGDSDIDAMVALPSPCVAPIVFVLSGSEDKWFAVVGFESGSGTHHPSHQPTTTHTSTTFTTTTMADMSGIPNQPPNPSDDPFGTQDNNPFSLPNDPFGMPSPFDNMASTVLLR